MGFESILKRAAFSSELFFQQQQFKLDPNTHTHPRNQEELFCELQSVQTFPSQRQRSFEKTLFGEADGDVVASGGLSVLQNTAADSVVRGPARAQWCGFVIIPA